MAISSKKKRILIWIFVFITKNVVRTFYQELQNVKKKKKIMFGKYLRTTIFESIFIYDRLCFSEL